MTRSKQSRPVTAGADVIDGIAKTIWLAEFSRAFSRTPSDPWENQAEPIKEGHRNTARNLIAAGYGPAVTPHELCVWQPIETAPKDGVRIDVWFQLTENHGARWANVSWSQQHQLWSNGPPSQYDRGWTATHWMPRPAAPTLPRADGGARG